MKVSDQKPDHGEIWWVNFEPSIGREYKHARPALVIQAVELDDPRVITIIPLTTKIKFIQSFDRSRFEFCIGTINEALLQQIKESLRVYLGIK